MEGTISPITSPLFPHPTRPSHLSQTQPKVDEDQEQRAVAFIYHASKGNIEKLKALIEEGVKIDTVDYDKRTALHLAASEGHLETVKFLVENAVDVNPVDRFGSTPATDSVRHRHPEITKYLLSKGGKINVQSLDVSAGLCKAVRDGDFNKVRSLVESGTDINFTDYESRTALHYAASCGKLEIAEFLVKAGAKVNVADRWGVTPLKEAINNKHEKIVELFKQSGAIIVDMHKFKSHPNLVSTLQQVLIWLCEEHHWEYGAAWFLTDDEKNLYASDAWYANEQYVSKLARYHRTQEYVPYGQGFVGTTAKTKDHMWLPNFQEVQKVVYQPNVVVTVGFRSGLALPILYNSELVAVLEFFSFTEKPKNLEMVTESMRKSTSMVVTEMLTLMAEGGERIPVSEQAALVCRLITDRGIFSSDNVSQAVNWYYQGLGLPRAYFFLHSPHLIAKHIIAFMTAKLYARDSGNKLSYRLEERDYALYFAESSSYETCVAIERAIEERYLGEGYMDVPYFSSKEEGISVKCFLSTGTIDPNGSSKLSIYLVSRDQYVNPSASEEETDLEKIATGAFLRDVDEETQKKYKEALLEKHSSMSVGVYSPNPQIIILTYRRGTTHSYFSSLTTLMKLHNITCSFKSIKQHSNDYTQYLLNVSGNPEDIQKLKEESNLLYILPRTSLFPLLEEEKLTTEEVVYAYASWKFAYHFLNKASEEFTQLWEDLKGDETNRNRLVRLKQTIRNEAATEAKVQEVIMTYYQLIKDFYADFRHHFKPRKDGTLPPSPSEYNSTLSAKIERTVPSILDCDILKAILVFNQHILKTNFYKSQKSALAVQLRPNFLPSDYPRVPYSIILFLGAEFRGFHVRFEAISRGGIRLIRSPNFHNFVKNAENVFSENYNLAYTQQRKNKDIPEGGSKGTILLSMTHQNKSETAFRKYIDSMLDLLLVTNTQKDPEIVDHVDREDIIFCGPDEGTADMMDWAAVHAKKRGYRYWSAFTTGKSVNLGGIPHDVYGMTTRGVHQYVLGVMRKKGIKEEDVVKVQTGGPDGDLGSNEILISKDKTKAIVDGSGVLYDPHGINRVELTRLAKGRKMIENFDREKLSKDGFVVLLADRDKMLPDGNKIENGMNFRNSFHLTPYASCDFFVPCGGRPESVTIQNVSKIFVNGEPIFKNIIEGANLFFTQEARLVLEKAGIPVLKDASANKGGVTSSSLEVLAALCFTNEEHETHMCVKNGVIPEFYKQYVLEVQRTIEENAHLEFECIWNEHIRTKIPMSTISDKLSEKINELNDTITNSNLWNNSTIKQKILKLCFPQVLQKLLGLDEIVKRLPASYISATLSAHLASRYIYEFGLSPGEFSFYEFMQRYA